MTCRCAARLRLVPDAAASPQAGASGRRRDHIIGPPAPVTSQVDEVARALWVAFETGVVVGRLELDSVECTCKAAARSTGSGEPAQPEPGSEARREHVSTTNVRAAASKGSFSVKTSPPTHTCAKDPGGS